MNLFDILATDPSLGFNLALVCLVVVMVIVLINHLPPPDRGVLV